MNYFETLLEQERRLPSVFFKAIDKDDIRTVRTMIKFGQNVSETNINQDNGLHIALQCRRVNPDMVELLLESGVSPEVENRQHKSASDIAVDLGNTPVVRRISKYLKNQSAINKTIKLASEKKHHGIKEVLKGKIYRVRTS